MLERPQARPAAYASILLALASSLGCGDDGDDGGDGGDEIVSQPSAPQGECRAVVTTFEGGGRDHVAGCSDVSYPMSPPVFGNHYPEWAAYQTYDFPIPLGYLVHDLEHGAVVLFYECPAGCADEVSEVQAFIDALPADPRCASFDIAHQVILVPRPGLGSRWAASAWGASITADCFDADLFGQFYADHVARGPEDLCFQGVAFSAEPCK